MNSFWRADAPATFAAFSPVHLICLGIFAASILLLFACRSLLRTSGRARAGRYILAGILALCEVSLNVWYVQMGVYNVKDTLPLELCSISLYLCVVMLLARSRPLFGIVYFTGIGGAMQALLTPDLGYDFPHFRWPYPWYLLAMEAVAAVILIVMYLPFAATALNKRNHNSSL